jgi:hypothetical protein
MLFAGPQVRVADRATFEAVLQLAERDTQIQGRRIGRT